LNALVHTGSGTFEQANKRRVLERVARDWCLTIRASQVIPVYPLDEDIKPGDIYIAKTPASEAQTLWKKRGFLAIDQRFARLHPAGYGAYYRTAYHIGPDAVPPHHWQFPPPGAGNSAETGARDNEEADTAKIPKNTSGVFEKTDWQSAPRAGFPSYSFDIKRGESLSGALPVQGVPVIMSALGARSVTGTVTITNAFTYGIDEVSLRKEWEMWASRADIKSQLRDYAPIGNGPVRCYLRIVTRVYLARTMNVSMVNQDNSAWKTSVGAPRDDISSFGPAGSAAGNLNDPQNLDTVLSKLPRHRLNDGSATPSEEKKTTTEEKTTTTEEKKTTGAQGAVGDPAEPALPAAPEPKPEATPATPAPKKSDLEKRVARREKEMNLKEKLADIEDREAALVKRQSTLQRNREQEEFDMEVFRRSLTRAGMKDRFGGWVVPGATLQVASATKNSISMNETFDRPLVIGYHAMDVPIYAGGEIGTPVSTYLALEGRTPWKLWARERETLVTTYENSQPARAMTAWLKKNPQGNKKIFLDWVGERSPQLKDLPMGKLVSKEYDDLLVQFMTEKKIPF